MKKPLPNWASSFPTNPLILSLLEDSASRLNKTQDEQDDLGLKCSACKLQGTINTSVHCFCVECLDHLCKPCFNDHNKFKLMRNHKILKGQDIPLDTSLFERMSMVGFCLMHEGRQVEYKCINHGAYICTTCVKTVHKKCKGIKDIQNIKICRDDFRNECVTHVEDSFKAAKATLRLRKDELQNCQTDVRETSTFLHDFKDIGVGLENEVKSNLQKLNSDSDELVPVVKTCTEVCDNIQSDLVFAEQLFKHGSDLQLVIAKDALIVSRYGKIGKDMSLHKNLHETEVKLLQKMINLSHERMKHIDGYKNHTVDSDTWEETRHPGTNSVSSVAEHQIKQDGTCDVTENVRTLDTGHLTTSSGVTVTERETTAQVSSLMQRSLIKTSEHDISLKNTELTCHHHGIVLLTDGSGSMVVIDANNKCLKLICSHFRVLDHFILEHIPNDITLSIDNKLIVVVEKSIQFFRVLENHQIVHVKSFSTSYEAYSVTCINDKFAILFSNVDEDTPESSIQIRNMNNEVLQNITTFGGLGRNVGDLSEPYLIRSRSANEIIVAEKSQISAFSLNGDLKWYFTLRGGQCPYYIGFDSENNIYISDHETSEIQQVAADSYKRHRTLIQLCGSLKPGCFLYNPYNETFVVGYDYCNKVGVYKFV